MRRPEEEPMSSDRRIFLKGAAGLAAASGAGALATPAAAQTPQPQAPHAFEMPRGMTLINMRRDGAYRLGAKTNKGVLDVTAARQALNMPAPADMDDLLQNGKGGVLKAVVDAANSRGPESVFLKEETVQYGPVVTRPEKIIMMGFNYRRHAEETNTPIPKNPVPVQQIQQCPELPWRHDQAAHRGCQAVRLRGRTRDRHGQRKRETSPRPTPSTMWRAIARAMTSRPGTYSFSPPS